MGHRNKQNTHKRKSVFSPINFIMKSSQMALILTFPPILALIIIWEIGLITPSIMICWVMFALFWTFYIILKVPEKID